MRDCEHCEFYVNNDQGYYGCSAWECVKDDKETDDGQRTTDERSKRI